MYNRFEIDYIKGLGILSILFYNANFRFFSGGLIGLDIFFVIAGYLTTLSILKDLDNKNFSLINFYEKRLRRLLPSFLLFCFSTFIIIIFFALPREILLWSELLIYSSTFLSNIYLWKNPIFQTNPLSHIWFLSLMVQFYLLFPLFLMYFYNVNKKVLFFFFIIVLFLSLSLSSYGSIYGRGYGSYYLLPFRGWEFLIGILVAQYEKNIFNNLSRNISKLLCLLGFFCIFISLFLFNKETPSPSFYNLAPTLGTAIIIIFYRNLNFELFSINKIVAHIGKISYSIFLFHVPIFYIYKNLNLKIPNDFEMIFLCLISIILAMINSKFIDEKLRNLLKIKKIFFYSLSTISVLFVIFLGLSGIKTNGFYDLISKYKFNDKQKKLYSLLDQNKNYQFLETRINQDCKIFSFNISESIQKQFDDCYQKHGSAILLIGDSLAMNLHNILAKTKKVDFLVTFAGGGCRIKNYPEKDCFYENLNSFLKKNASNIKVILYHDNGLKLLQDKNGQVGTQLLFDTDQFNINQKRINNIIKNLDKFSKINNISLIWIGPKVSYVYNTNKIIFWNEAEKIHKNSRKIFHELEEKIATSLKSNIGFKYLNFDKLYKIKNNVILNDCLFWKDEAHLSDCAEDIISKTDSLNDFIIQLKT